MRWTDKKRLGKRHCKTTINRDNLRKCLFRFLKEFRYFHSYIREIKNILFIAACIYNEELGHYVYHHERITYAQFLKQFRTPINRGMFPNAPKWDDIYKMWVYWAKEEDEINEKTQII